jgi:hypothetical protein
MNTLAMKTPERGNVRVRGGHVHRQLRVIGSFRGSNLAAHKKIQITQRNLTAFNITKLPKLQ